jgi:hypothetical protein
MGGGPEARAFFDAPEGQHFLHTLLVVLLLVVVLQCGAGVERVQFCFKALGLDKRIACSRAHLQLRVITMSKMVRDFGVQTTLALCAKLGGRTINIVADEMWLAGTMLLVALDPVTGWICVQKTALRRDGDTWTREVQDACKGMSLTIRTVGADCAKGLIHMALSGLGVTHSADLFHGQYELTGAYSRRLAVRVQAAEKAHGEALAQAESVREAQRRDESGPRGPGRPPQWSHRVAVAEHQQRLAASALREAQTEQASMREVVRGLSATLHPIDLRTGAPTDEERVVAKLEALLDRGYAIAEGLGAQRTKAVEKVRRTVPCWGATVTAWWSQVRARVDGLKLSTELRELVLTLLIPALYVDLVRARNHVDAAEREKLGRTLDGLLARLRTAPSWQALSTQARADLIALGEECAGWFVRCTGSVEGHNGWLRLRFHQLHAVTADWLETQRVLHNFLIRRADGTTAAERLFRATHGDLVEYLTARMPLPALPRRRTRRVESTAQRLNL